MRADLHTHTLFSDGLDTPELLIARAVDAGLDAVAVTDHDTADGLPRARAAASRMGIDLVAGLEMSAQVEGHSVHLLMYGGDPAEPALAAELKRIRRGRDVRIPAMVDRLGELGMPLTADEVAAFADDASSIGRPHVADALVARGYVADRAEAFSRWLADDKPGYVGRYATPLLDAIALVRRAGGVAVVAHAWSRSGRHHLPERLLADLVTDHGLDGFEADHPDHLPAQRVVLHALADRLGVLATGSSDYHGAGKKAGYHLGACTTDSEQYGRLRALIAERTAD
jgi:predicted metal-dependent phosphoesterase TrpH